MKNRLILCSGGEGLRLRVDDIAPVEVAAGKAHDEHFSGGEVGGKGDVVLVAELGDIGQAVVILRVGGVAEEEDHIDLVVGDARADLLGAAVDARHEQVDRKAARFADHLTGHAGGAESVTGQNAGVSRAELDHQFLFVVVCHESDVHVVSQSFLM